MRKAAVGHLLAPVFDVEEATGVDLCVVRILTFLFGTGARQEEFADFLT
jgi:hypothetical protein